MSKVHVTIKKDDRVWDSIKPSKYLALQRIAVFMKDDHDFKTFVTGRSILNKLNNQQPVDEIIELLKSPGGYEVTVKEQEQANV